MKLLSVHIENYRAIEKLTISFLDSHGVPKPIIVAAGPNGSGKTSILYAITQALRGVMGYRTVDVPAPTRDDVRANGLMHAGWVTKRREVRVDVTIKFGDDEQVAIVELLRILKMSPPPKLPNGELKIHWKFPPGFSEDGSQLGWWTASMDPPLQFVRSWLQARKLAIRAWMRREAGMRQELLTDIGGLLFFPQDRNLRERVVADEFDLKSTSGAGLRQAESDVDDDFDRPAPRERTISEILHFLSDYAAKRVPPLPEEQNWEKRIQEIFARVCKPKEYVGYLYRGEEDQIGSPVLRDGEKQYPLSHAASGEQVILEYITRLTYPSPLANSIVLIDEPEIHLHPAWIRQFYLALPGISRGNQYLLTTHSAELRKRAAADNCLIDLGALGQIE